MIKLEIRGQEDLARKLEQGMPASKVRKVMVDAMAIGHRSVEDSLRNKGTGLAVQTVRSEMKVAQMTARVYSVMSAARQKSMHEGRRGGSRLPLVVVARWVLGRPHLTSRRLSDLSAAERRTVIEARDAIEAGGARAVAYWPEAKRAVVEALPGLLADMAREMEQEFGR